MNKQDRMQMLHTAMLHIEQHHPEDDDFKVMISHECTKMRPKPKKVKPVLDEPDADKARNEFTKEFVEVLRQNQTLKRIVKELKKQ